MPEHVMFSDKNNLLLIVKFYFAMEYLKIDNG